MGWTFTHRDKKESALEFFRREFARNGNGDHILDAATKESAVYIAYRTEDNKVVCIICLVKWARDPYYNFGYKDMDETMGVYESKCPKRILQMLSPVEDITTHPESMKCAVEWRKRCWDYINTPKIKLHAGDLVEFATELDFRSHGKAKVLRVKSTKPLRFTHPDGWGLYRVHRSSLVGCKVV